MTLTLTTLLLCLLQNSTFVANAPANPSDAGYKAWDTLLANRVFAELPIQDGGRVKPMSTYAGFMLLRLNGKRACRTPEGKTLTPSEWLLDCLFLPERAQQYRIFLVDDSAVLDTIGISHSDRKKRDRYSYAELAPARERLFDLAQRAAARPPQQLGAVESKVLRLAQNFADFERLIHHFDFARHDFHLPESSPLSPLLPNGRFSEIVRNARVIAVVASALHRGEMPPGILDNSEIQQEVAKILPDAVERLDAERRTRLLDEIETLLREVDALAAQADALAIFPPEENDATWLTPGDFVQKAFFGGALSDTHLRLLEAYETLPREVANPYGFKTQLTAFHDEVVTIARTRGEYNHIPLEVLFYRLQLFYHSLVLFALCFVLTTLSWMAPRNKWLTRLGFYAPLVPLALLITGIAMRCIIRGRPPVTTLYETILFATAVAVLIAWFVEWTDRKKIALSVGTFLGAVGMFLAFKYEAKEGVDTMPSLIAVLDTNFWLATHVTTITIGYGAGLLAGALAHVYIFGKFIRAEGSEHFYDSVTDTVYGVLCFSLVFSVLGTVLGGIWAAESWGRFWGWDPKENGALLIVLWQLAILHARKGGYIRELGLHAACVFQNIVVAFSWWGINQLGVGLHSYGQTSGIMRALIVFYAFELVVLTIAALVWMQRKRTATAT